MIRKEGYKRVTIDLDPTVSAALKVAAKREETTVAFVVRRALREYIKSQTSPGSHRGTERFSQTQS